MPVPTIDFEIFSEAGFVWSPPSDKYPLGRWVAPPGAKEPGISAVGAAAYAEHPSTEVLTVSYDLCDGRGIRRWQPGKQLPLDLFEHIAKPDSILEAHNAMFERLIWEKVCVVKYGWPMIDWRKWRCSFATALVAQRPGALGNLGEVLGLDIQKDKEGSRLIKKFSIPQQPIVGLVDKKTGRVKRPDQPARRIYPHDDPEDFEKFCAYCDQDVRAEMAAMEKLPPLSPQELEAWQFTFDQNYRGLAVDREGLRACIDILGKVLERYGAECRELTGSEITQLEKLKGWLSAYGVRTDSLDADAIATLLDAPHVTGPARRLLELRSLTGSASVKKTLAIENRCSSDNRLRDIVVHHGTRPGRPTGEGPQPLNLPKAGPKLAWCPSCQRPSIPQPLCPWCGSICPAAPKTSWTSSMVDHVLEIMSIGSLEFVESFFGDAMLAIQGCVRGLFVAGEGTELVSTDYSSLQAVVLACLSGEQWRIDAFRRGDPIYLLGASKITGTPVEEYLRYYEERGEHHPDRQKIGKVSELACLSPETQVLTARGYVAIKDVCLTDVLWDGEEWVSHAGLIDKGVRTVVSLDGVKMTPDHLILCNGFWMEAGQLVSNENTRSLALATGSANLPSSMRPAIPFKLGAPAGMSRQLSCLISSAASRLGAMPARRKLRGGLARIIGGMRISLQTTNTVDAFLTEFLRALRAAVRGMRLKGRPIMPHEVFGFSMSGGRGQKVDAGFWPTLSRSRGGTTLRWNWTESEWTAITNPETSGSLLEERTRQTNDRLETCKPSSISTSRVYDIALAGPRNRFTIKTDSGHLIVHNCGFQGWIGSYRAFGSEEPDDVIKRQILGWRAASPAIVEMWGGQSRGRPWENKPRELFGLEGMFIAAVENPGQYFEFRKIGFLYDPQTDCLEMLLPPCDGHRRPLRYHEPRLTPSERNPNEKAISYSTWNTNPNYGARGWVRMPTWGGRLTENCLAEGTEVLTGRGWIPIERVRNDDSVHDGIELVNHRGRLYKGSQGCVAIDGVWMTPDHKVFDDGQNWQSASSICGLYRPDLRDADGFGSIADRAGGASSEMAFRLPVRPDDEQGHSRRKEVGSQGSDSELRMLDESVHRGEANDSRNDRDARLFGLAVYGGSLSSPDPSIVEQLRRAWNSGLRSMVGIFRKLLGRHGSNIFAGFGFGSRRQRSGVLAGQLPLGVANRQFEQSGGYDLARNERGSRDAGGRVSTSWASAPRGLLAAGQRMVGGRPSLARGWRTANVYDLLNCGPRRRFVVRGAEGPFIVHNCVMGVEVDIQRYGAKLMAQHGYPLVLSVYDENVAEIPIGKPLTLGLPPVEGYDPYVQEVEHLLSIMPPELADWPIRAADGWRGRRYRKG